MAADTNPVPRCREQGGPGGSRSKSRKECKRKMRRRVLLAKHYSF
jgi:hypothetical protein